MINESRYANEFLNRVPDDTTLMQLRQDSSVHVGEFLLVPSPDKGGGDQGEDTLIMDRSNEKKKMKITEKKGKNDNKKKRKMEY